MSNPENEKIYCHSCGAEITTAKRSNNVDVFVDRLNKVIDLHRGDLTNCEVMGTLLLAILDIHKDVNED